MIPWLVRSLLSLNEPHIVIRNACIYIAIYYSMAGFFHHYATKANYHGIWRKKGWFDAASSVLWVISAALSVASLIDLLIRNNFTLPVIFAYYVLFIFLFAFIYNLLGWHFEEVIDPPVRGWNGEIQCVTMSIQVMTGGYHTSAKPAKAITELIAGAQAVLGVIFVAVIVAKAVEKFAR